MAKSRLEEKWDEIGDNPLIMVNELTKVWAQDSTEYMDDEDFGKVLDLAIRIIAGREDLEHQKVAMLCVRLEAYAIKFRMMYTAYMSYKKGTLEANMKKNHYKELYIGTDRLVDSLKYLIR